MDMGKQVKFMNVLIGLIYTIRLGLEITVCVTMTCNHFRSSNS